MLNIKRTDLLVGLSSNEAILYLKEFGENTIYHRKKLKPVIMFFKKFNNPLLYILMGASIISFFFGQKVNAIILIVMIFVSVILDFFNSYKSEKVAEKLVEKVASTATIIRDGKKQEIPFHRLVPGDIVMLSAGDVVPADCVVLSADDFFVNQSALTGESFPIEKFENKDKSLLDSVLNLSDMTAVFMGTSVVTGYAIVQIAQTGSSALFGKIADKLSKNKQETSFEHGLKRFSFFILRLTIIMVIIVFLVNTLYGRGVFNSFLFAAAIAVGLTPELLPVIMSVTLSYGSLRMAKKGVILKNLAAVQNFGSMDIFCTDKTGTLTQDKIELIKCVNMSGSDSKNTLLYSYLNSIYHTARKSPMDEAVQTHGKMDTSLYTKIDEIPFDFERKRDSVVVEYKRERFIVTKGAPESILNAVVSFEDEGNNILEFNNETKKIAKAEYDKLSADGFRVLAIAIKKVETEERTKYTSQEEEAMIFIGYAAFFDPPKKDALLALEELKELSVDVKIITGDSEILTERICKELDIKIKGVITGEIMDTLSDEEFSKRIDNINIFARVSPVQKERVVRLLQKAGHTVGYMGDGINDAPVLKIADVGISVNNGVDVAKETADIILLNKNLQVLRDGVIEGRKTFQNTLKYIKMGFSSNFGNMFSMMGASFFLPFFPMLSSQILLNNFLYDVSQTTIPTDTTDIESVREPLKWNMKEFFKYIIAFGIVSSVFDFLTFYLLYGVFHLKASQFQTGWFIESIATQILVIFIIRTKRSPFFRSTPGIFVTISAISVVALAWIIPYTPLGSLLSFDPLPPILLLFIMGIVITYLIIAEISKYFFYKLFAKAQ